MRCAGRQTCNGALELHAGQYDPMIETKQFRIA